MLGRRDIKVKYKQSALGPLWLVLQPLGMLLAISIAFSKVTSVNTGDVPYVVFALVGLAVWTYVQMTISVAPHVAALQLAGRTAKPVPSTSLRHRNADRRAPAPGDRAHRQRRSGGDQLPPRIQALLMPVLVAWLLVLMWGFTLLVAALGGRFRDAIAFAPLIVQAGIFLTPVGYPLDAAGSFAKVLALNPASGLIEGWRWSLSVSRLTALQSWIALVETVGLPCSWAGTCSGGWSRALRTMSEIERGRPHRTSPSVARGVGKSTALGEELSLQHTLAHLVRRGA